MNVKEGAEVKRDDHGFDELCLICLIKKDYNEPCKGCR